jgi:hypothetical protein
MFRFAHRPHLKTPARALVRPVPGNAAGFARRLVQALARESNPHRDGTADFTAAACVTALATLSTIAKAPVS